MFTDQQVQTEKGVATKHRESTLPPSWPSQPFAPQGGEPPPSDSGSPSPPPCRAAGEPGAALQTCQDSLNLKVAGFVHRQNNPFPGRTISPGKHKGAGFYLNSVSFSLSSENSCMARFLWLWASFSSLDWDFIFSAASTKPCSERREKRESFHILNKTLKFNIYQKKPSSSGFL